MRLSRLPSDLRSILQSIVDELQCANPNVAIDLAVAGDLSGEWDSERLSQLISNLVMNAIQHGHAGRVIVRAENENGGVSIEIHNDGLPIPQDSIATIFNPLERESRSDHSSTGSGAGSLYLPRDSGGAWRGHQRYIVPGCGDIFRPASEPSRGKRPESSASSRQLKLCEVRTAAGVGCQGFPQASHPPPLTRGHRLLLICRHMDFCRRELAIERSVPVARPYAPGSRPTICTCRECHPVG